MEKYYLQTIGTPIINDQGAPLSRVTDVVINTETGKIIAFAASAKKAVSPIDILEWNNVIRISDPSDLIDPRDIHEYQKAHAKNITIYQKKVFTFDGEYVGRVIDIGMDNKHFRLSCLVVAKSLINIFFWDKKIISSQDIIEITKKKIIIKNLVRPVKMKKLKVDMAGEY